MRASEEYELINQYTSMCPVNVQGLISALGIQYREAFLADNISGMLERSQGGGYTITVNAGHPVTRKRFTAAHELGHYINHRHLVGDGVDDNKAYRSTDEGKYHNTNIGPVEETEANKFAATVLMPRSLVVREYNANNNPADLARAFGVSEMSMKWRLVNLRLATKAQLGLR